MISPLGKELPDSLEAKGTNVYILTYFAIKSNSLYYLTDMKLIVGLGNPETRYDNTRHNIGFMALDSFTQKHGISFSLQKKFKAEIAETSIQGEKVLLLKPHTYYNLSGESVRAAADFYKIAPEDILLIHDELMLPFGTIRTRLGGRDAGNNGIKSINQHMGEQTARIRFGVSNSTREHIDDVNFVLGKLSKEEQAAVPELLDLVGTLIERFAAGDFETTTHR